MKGSAVRGVKPAENDVARHDAPDRGLLLRYVSLILALLAAWAVLYLALPGLSQWLTYEVFGLSEGTAVAEAVEFFLYDAPKVLLLLTLIVFAMGIVRTFFTPERTRALLAGRREAVGGLLAASLGIVTPFCSCSAVPLFVGFVGAGVPLGVTLSFLVAAPMVNEVALVLLYGMFGWQIAVLYLLTGLAVAVSSGFVIGRLRPERWVEPWVFDVDVRETEQPRLDWMSRIRAGRHAVIDIVGRTWPFVLAGIAVGAVIHGYVPEDLLAQYMDDRAWWGVPLAVLLGVPMYANAAAMIPVVEALLAKGAALGTVLAFMMAVIALSLPEFVILRRVLRPRLIAVFVGVVTCGILFVGYLFNLLEIGRLVTV